MKISPAGLALIKRFEGFRNFVYLDAVGKATIGWGHLLLEGESFPQGITEQEGDAMLEADLAPVELAVSTLVRVPLTQPQFDALCSFTYNEGVGTLRRSTMLQTLNAGRYAAIPDALYHVDESGQHGFIFAGGNVLPGLVARRQAEIALWNS